MKKQTTYLTQYFNLKYELELKGITISNANEDTAKQLTTLRANALEQSGLLCGELTLIWRCRRHNIFKKVSAYSLSLKKN